MGNRFKRGAEWRKWDLHLHAPSKYTCAKNDCYEGASLEEKQENFLKELKCLEDVSVLGVTDYFSLEGYKYIISKKEELSNIDLILPNIELRITPVTDKSKKINIHMIFNPENLSTEDIEDFLYKFEYGTDKGTCKEKNLIELGKKIDKSLSDEKAFEKGLNEFNISYDTFFKMLEGAKPKIKENIIIAVANSSNDGASGIKDIPEIRNLIYRGVDFIFSSKRSDKDYFLGNKVDSKEEIINKYGKLLACFHGSDYHGGKNGKKICVPDLKRFCWVKADPTFEGLKQAMVELGDRIFISENGEKPEIIERVENNKTKYIDNLIITHEDGYDESKGVWFKDVNIDLNKELIAIIGNKGSGKSALSDIISLCGNSKDSTNFSFLNNKKFKKGQLAKNFKSSLTWEDSTQNQRNLSEDNKNQELADIKYLPQGDFEKLTNEIVGASEFQKELEDIIFSHVPEEHRLKTASFKELIEKKGQEGELAIAPLVKQLNTLNKEIIELERKSTSDYKEEIEAKLKKKDQELSALVEPTVVEEPQDKDETKVSLVRELKDGSTNMMAEIEAIKKDIIELNTELSELDLMDSKFKSMKNKVDDFLDENEGVIKKYNLEDSFSITYNQEYIHKRKEIKNNRLEELTLKLDGSDASKGLLKKQIDLKEELEKLTNSLDEPNKLYEIYLKELKSFSSLKNSIIGTKDSIDTIEYYKNIVNYLENYLQINLNEKLDKRKQISKDILEEKMKVLNIYSSIKGGIDLKIDENKDLLEGYDIQIINKLNFDENFDKEYLGYINQSKAGSYYGKESGSKILDGIIKDIEFNTSSDAIDLVDALISSLVKDKRETSLGEERLISQQIDDIEGFYDFLFSFSFLKYTYNLKLGDRELNQLSPGERGTVLLIFYLLLDDNNIPLILDQPEDNLDNHSVANVLVPFIKKAKQKRQIILVTHNPNLAVVADAEQTIWVNIDKNNNNTFEYISGSIEDKNVNNKVVEILEGAMPAFKKRKEKYYA